MDSSGNSNTDKRSVGKSPRISRRGFLRFARNVVMGGTAVSIGGWNYVDFERGWVKINKETFKLPGLPAAFSGMVIAHLSDLHFSYFITPARISEIVEKVNNAAPDMVIITGDFIDKKTDLALLPMYTQLLNKMKGPLGKYAVLGNHDHRRGAYTASKLLESSGFKNMSNRSTSLKIGDDLIRICGVDSIKEGKDDLGKMMDDLPEDGLAILLVHEPDFADTSGATGRFALQLSGHSHGGQVYVPLYGPLVTPRFGKKYPRGRYVVNGMQLYTNRGIGMVQPYVRFNCRPEIALIKLESA